MVIEIINIKNTCKCGCLFSYEKEDIQKKKEEHMVVMRKDYTIFYYNYFVKCPVCKEKLFLYNKDIK